jgi:hypothetical protein
MHAEAAVTIQQRKIHRSAGIELLELEKTVVLDKSQIEDQTEYNYGGTVTCVVC